MYGPVGELGDPNVACASLSARSGGPLRGRTDEAMTGDNRPAPGSCARADANAAIAASIRRARQRHSAWTGSQTAVTTLTRSPGRNGHARNCERDRPCGRVAGPCHLRRVHGDRRDAVGERWRGRQRCSASWSARRLRRSTWADASLRAAAWTSLQQSCEREYRLRCEMDRNRWIECAAPCVIDCDQALRRLRPSPICGAALRV